MPITARRSISMLDVSREDLQEKLSGARLAKLCPDPVPELQDERNGLRPKYTCGLRI